MFAMVLFFLVLFFYAMFMIFFLLFVFRVSVIYNKDLLYVISFNLLFYLL